MKAYLRILLASQQPPQIAIHGKDIDCSVVVIFTAKLLGRDVLFTCLINCNHRVAKLILNNFAKTKNSLTYECTSGFISQPEAFKYYRHVLMLGKAAA